MKHRILSIFVAIVVTLSLSACQNGDTEQTATLSDSSVSETGSEVTTNVDVETQASETTENYDPYDHPVYPLPEGWSFEKICGLVEIDGVSLPFPCTIEDIKNINNIEVNSYDTNYYDIIYNNQYIGEISIDNEKNTSKYILLDFFDNETDNIIKEMTFASYNAEQGNEINNYIDENFDISYDYRDNDDYMKVLIYENSNDKIKINFYFNNSALHLIFIQLEEIENE